jgi:hypothetical protein
MSGDEINGLTCTGYPACGDPFTPIAKADHKGPQADHSEQAASFAGKDGKYPGSIRAMTDCPGDCGAQLVRSVASAAGPAGGYAGYVTVGATSANHNLAVDDKGRLVSTAASEVDNVSIGPKNEVHFSSLITTVQAFGTGAENTKDGRADIRIADFYILDNPVELTRAGLRLANAGPSEQEAYDGAKVLLKKLKDRGITLELPDFGAQVTKSPDHATVDALGLRVYFDQAVGPVDPSAINYPLELGHASAVVAAVDANRKIDVKDSPNGPPVVVNTPPAPGPAPAAPPPNATRSTGPSAGHGKGMTASGGPKPTLPGGVRVEPPSSGPSGVNAPPPAAGNPQPAGNAAIEPGASSTGDTTAAAPGNPDENALQLRDLQRKLGLRDARSVSRAFGAFFGLGLILPLARFVIRRLG